MARVCGCYPTTMSAKKRVLFTPQFFDPLERQILEARIRDGFVFVDIGANIGAYSPLRRHACRRQCPHSRGGAAA